MSGKRVLSFVPSARILRGIGSDHSLIGRMTVIYWKSFWNVDIVNEEPTWLWIFGDNVCRRGKGGQAVIRDCENAMGIPTKIAPRWDSKAFFTDACLETNKRYIRTAVDDIISVLEADCLGYEVLILPGSCKRGCSIGSGRAKMTEKCPLTYRYLLEEIQRLIDAALLINV